MTVNWADEQYARLYKLDSAHWVMGPWQARAMLPLVLRKLDRAGIMDLGTYGLRWVAKATEMPLDVVEPGLAWWIECDTLEIRGQYLVMPNYVEAQECSHSDKARKMEERARKRDHALAQERLGFNVTFCDQMSRRGTNCDNEDPPSSSELDLDEDDSDLDEDESDVTNCDDAVTKRDSDVTNCDEKSRAPRAESHAVTPRHSLLCSAVLCSAVQVAPDDAASRNVTSGEPLKLTAPPHTPTQSTRPKGSWDLDLSVLTNAERAVHAAIVADESLRPIVRTPTKLAKDLARVGPGINIVDEIAKAGAWLRANPARQKKNGARFLLNWIERQQERFGGRDHSSRGQSVAESEIDRANREEMARRRADQAATRGSR